MSLTVLRSSQGACLELTLAEAASVEQMMESPAGKYAVPAFFTCLYSIYHYIYYIKLYILI